MKKALIILASFAAALVSCNQEILDDNLEESTAPVGEIVFNLSANHPDGTATKAVKTGWETDDVIFVFFSGQAAPKYLEMKWNGTSWVSTPKNGLALAESETGTMRAVYLPFGNSFTVSSSGTAFTFGEVTYSYYLTAQLPYTVTGGTVSGTFSMQIPDGYVQFFLDDAAASPEVKIELREPHLTPQGITSIAAEDTKETGESKGYLFSGILADGVRNTATDYYFTLVSGGWQGSYYAKAFAGRTWYRGPTEGRALKMPALGEWTPVTDYILIDLGIDVGGKRIYWAKCNLGAITETDFGDYFAWGETTGYKGGKTSFIWNNYAWGTAQALTKYCNVSSNGKDGFTDTLTTLEKEDDAASVALGGIFRMPTSTEISALLATMNDTENYTWTWCDGSTTKYNDSSVKGYMIVKKTSTATLFLPAAGQYYGATYRYGGVDGTYWTSSLNTTGDPDRAWILCFPAGSALRNNGERGVYGFPVRPVSE